MRFARAIDPGRLHRSLIAAVDDEQASRVSPPSLPLAHCVAS